MEKAGFSPSDRAPEQIHIPDNLFPHNPEPASSKEAIHDAPEVIGSPQTFQSWASSIRPTSPFSENETVVSGFQPFDYNEKGEPVNPRRESELPAEPADSKVCGIPRKYLMGVILLVFVLLLAIGLGVGLGIGLTKDKHKSKPNIVDQYCIDNPQYCIGGALGSLYYTTNGTFNGSGIALATEFWNHQEYKIMTVYFQHWKGDIRSIQLTPDGQWVGGTQSEVIVSDAKNATPISTVSYAVNGTAQWHLFYVDKNGYVRQKQNSNSTNIWEDGPLNQLNLTAYDAPNVGLQACWYGNYYGDTDAAAFPTFNGQNNTIPFNHSTPGMHLWYPSDDTTFRQYGWYEGQAQWEQEQTWTGKNAHAGVGCYSWDPGTVTYTMMVDTSDVAEVWWKDTASNVTSTSSHPINSWQNATQISIPNVHPSTSLGYTDYFYAQMDDGTIKGHLVNWAAENTTSSDADTFTVGSVRGPVPGLKGTHMSVGAVPDQSGGTSLYVFYQTRGDDLSVFIRDYKGGQWTQGELPIPDA